MSIPEWVAHFKNIRCLLLFDPESPPAEEAIGWIVKKHRWRQDVISMPVAGGCVGCGYCLSEFGCPSLVMDEGRDIVLRMMNPLPPLKERSCKGMWDQIKYGLVLKEGDLSSLLRYSL